MDVSSAASSRLIGAIFVEKGLVTQEQLERAVELQEQTGERLGEIVVSEFGVSRIELASVLAEQWAEFERQGRESAESAESVGAAHGSTGAVAAPDRGDENGGEEVKRPIGEIFVERGFVTEEQLSDAVERQRDTGQRLGEVLVERGSLSRLDLASALAEQWSTLQKLRPPAPVAPEPWQNRAVGEAASESPPQAHDVGALVELEERVRVVEHAAAALPRQEDMQLLAADLRAAIGKVDERVALAAGEAPAIEGLAHTVDELRARLEALADQAARPVEVQGLAELRAQVDELAARASAPVEPEGIAELRTRLEALAQRLDEPVLPEGLADLQVRVDELALRVAEPVVPADLADLPARVEELADRVSRPAEPEGLAELRTRLEALAQRVADPVVPEGLADLQLRIEELAERTAHPAEPEGLAELRTRVSEIGARRFVDPELTHRVDAVAGQAQVAQTGLAALSSRIDELGGLTARVDDIAARMPGQEVIEDLRRALVELADQTSARADDDRLAALVARVDQLGARLEDVAADRRHRADAELQTAVGELRGRLDALAARPQVDPDEVASRLSELEQREHGVQPDELAAVSRSLDEQRLQLETRLGELAERLDDTSAVAALQARVDELGGLVAASSGTQQLEDRLAALEQRAADPRAVDRLRDEVHRLAVAATGERASLEHAMHARLDELRETIPAAADLDDLRERVAELASRVAVGDEAQARLDDLGARLDALDGVGESVQQLHDAVARDGEALRSDAAATGLKLASLEAALAAVDERIAAAISLREGAAEDRLDDMQRRLAAIAKLEEHVAEVRAELATRPAAEEIDERTIAVRQELDRLAGRVETLQADLATRLQSGELVETADTLRAELAGLAERLESRTNELAERPQAPDLTSRLDELTARLDELARAGEDRASGLAAALNARIDDAERRTEGLAGRDEVAGNIAEHAAALRAELETLRLRSDTHARSIEERLAGLADASALAAAHERLEALESAVAEGRGAVDVVRDDLARRLEETAAEMRAELETRSAERSAAQQEQLAALQTQVGEMRTDVQESTGRREELEGRLDGRLDELSGRLAHETERTRAELDGSGRELRAELASLAMRVDELLGLRRSDVQAALESQAGLAARVDALDGLRSDDLERARVEGAELAARLDDLALRTAAAAADSERALRDEIVAVAARLEQQDAADIEARDELRVELERIASSASWRLERIEESLASDDRDELRASLQMVERRLDEQRAQQDEQARATERALRKGLASLGERLAGTESAYVEAGNTLRRSIERLGAAVVEADARMADQIPVSEAEGYVAFAPTPEGYRLVTMDGAPPEVGATVEVEGCAGPLVVTRFGRSPLPLDARPCAYLDRP